HPLAIYEFAKQVLEIRYKDQGLVSRLLDLVRVFIGFYGPPNAAVFSSEGKIASTLEELGFDL
ncbi:MAG: hypothetical protein KUG73_11850, partial [Pseudomonadales bacterium]|nr:hypothetical protein [Pseudomonadales bacterium]